MLPVIEGLADGLSKLTDTLSGLTDEQRKNIVVALGVVAAIGPLLLAFAALAKVIAVAATAIKVISAFFVALSSPLALTVMGIAAVGAAAYMLGQRFLGLKQAGEWLGQWLFDTWERMPEIIEAAKAAVLDFAQEILIIAAGLSEKIGK